MRISRSVAGVGHKKRACNCIRRCVTVCGLVQLLNADRGIFAAVTGSMCVHQSGEGLEKIVTLPLP